MIEKIRAKIQARQFEFSKHAEGLRYPFASLYNALQVESQRNA